MISGVITDEFKQVALSECCRIISGSTPSRKMPDFWDGDINWFTPKDLSKLKSKYVSSSPEKITQLGQKSCSTTLLPAGSLLLSSRAPIGHIAIATKESCTNQGFKSLIPNNDVYVDYLYYAVKKIVPRLQYLGNGATFKEISKATLAKVEIPLPPLAEQQKIAAILDAADQLRQKDQQLIDHYTTLSQSLFLEMFGDPVTNPMGWDSKKLGNSVNFLGGGTPSRKNLSFYTGDIPWVTSKDMKGTFLYDAQEHVTEEAVAKSSTKLVPKNSLLIVVKSKILMHTLPVLITKVKVCFNQDVKAITPNPDVEISYLFLYLKNMQNVILRKARGVNTEGLTLNHLKSLEIPIPPLQLQNQFAQHIEKIEQQKQQAQASLEKSEALFNSLLQRAFKGELTQNSPA